jgi:hypothetical protein
MVLRAEFVHGVDEHSEMVGIDVGRNPVTEVKHVARPLAVTLENVRNSLPNHLG